MPSRLLVQFVLAIAARIPPRAARALAGVLATLEYRLSPKRRAAVLANLAAIGASGHPLLARARNRDRTARAIFRSYHRFLFEFLAQHRLATAAAWHASFRFSGMEMLYGALAQGRGAIVAAAHLGNWELAGLALARQGFQVHVVTGMQLHPLLHRGIRSLKEASGIAVSTPADGFLPLLETLRRGGVVVLLVDGDVYTRGVSTRFFGRTVPFPAGPALLARRSGAPLLHAHASRFGSTHRVSFDGIDRSDPELPLKTDVVRLTSRVAAAQERNIAAHLGQWCIFRPFFVASARKAGASAA